MNTISFFGKDTGSSQRTIPSKGRDTSADVIVRRSYFDEMWDKFIIKGDQLYNHMISNYELMFDTNFNLRHFGITYGSNWGLIDHVNTINKLYNADIQINLIKWVQNEYNENRLFTEKYWKPFRDSYTMNDMHLGYKIMFVYKNYYFQLIIESICNTIGECIYCNNYSDNNKSEFINFSLALYGWKDDMTDKLQPDNEVSILSDNIMPDYYWNQR